MIRLTWLQFRTQAAVAAAALAIAAIALAVTGPHLPHQYTGSGTAACQARGICPGADTARLLSLAVIAVPGIIGLFWGAPLIARELETHSYRLAWTQGITRTRWLAGKLAVTGAASIAAAGLASLMLTWWASPSTQPARTSGRHSPSGTSSRPAPPPSPSPSASPQGC